MSLDKRNGIVIKSTGANHLILLEDGEKVMCVMRGSFRLKGIQSTSPVVVGDFVTIDEADTIVEIADRKNYIVRRPTNLSKQLHIIAANLDQVVLVATIKHPETSTVFIDRFLATAEAYRVPAVILFNKVDLLDDEEKEYLENVMYLYNSIGYKCVALSALQNDVKDELKSLFESKTTLISGNSGVGKSTLINNVMGDTVAKTSSISSSHHKGMHTTTFSEVYQLPYDSANSLIIDTPGIKAFGIIDFKIEEVAHYFPEMFAASANCKYNNCTHQNEPGCAVLEQLAEHKISQSRYNSYLSMLNELKTNSKYRA